MRCCRYSGRQGEANETLQRAQHATTRGQRRQTLYLDLTSRRHQCPACAECHDGGDHGNRLGSGGHHRDPDSHGDARDDEPWPQPALPDHAEPEAGEQSAGGNDRHEDSGPGIAPPKQVDRQWNDENVAGSHCGGHQDRDEDDRAHIAPARSANPIDHVGVYLPKTSCRSDFGELGEVDPHSGGGDRGNQREHRGGGHCDGRRGRRKKKSAKDRSDQDPDVLGRAHPGIGPNEIGGSGCHRWKQRCGRRTHEHGRDSFCDGNHNDDCHRRKERR